MVSSLKKGLLLLFAAEDEGPNENDMVVLPSGSLLVVARADSGDGVPRRLLRAYFAVASSDRGKTWTTPKPMTATDGSQMGSARPRLLLLGRLKNGVRQGPLMLTGGRPGLYLWLNTAADGQVRTTRPFLHHHRRKVAPKRSFLVRR